MDWIIPLITLVVLEVVLGLDNVIFISIVASKLPENQQKKARRLGLILAMFLRLILLGLISLILKLEGNLFTIFDVEISGKDVILIVGGLFLIYKSATEIHHKMEGESGDETKQIKPKSFKSVIGQILLLDLVFSVDSIITAIGMVNELWIMYVAVVVSVGIMLFASESISRFINKHPAFKMLALSFLLLIGVSLIGEGLDMHIPKGYIYFSMAFAALVDIFQMKIKPDAPAVETKEHYLPKEMEQAKSKDLL